MECEVNFTAKSMRLRYKLLSIENEHYLIDSDQPIWVMFIPFAYWLMPHTVYRVSDQEVLEQIKSPTVKQEKASFISIFGIGMTVLLSRLLESLTSYLDINTNPIVTLMIFLISATLLISLRIYIGKINQRNLYKFVKPERIQKRRLLINILDIIIIFVYIVAYFLVLLFLSVAVYAYFVNKNIMLLIYALVFMFIILLANILTMIIGITEVKFKKDKHIV